MCLFDFLPWAENDEGKNRMASLEEQVLRASKEIVVKFIEVGRVSPTGFPELFKSVYRTVDQAVKRDAVSPPELEKGRKERKKRKSG